MTFDPDGSDGEYEPGVPEDPAGTLAHELQHFWDYCYGTLDRCENPRSGVRKSEERAVRTENIARAALNLKLREKYGKDPVEYPGPEHSPLSPL